MTTSGQTERGYRRELVALVETIGDMDAAEQIDPTEESIERDLVREINLAAADDEPFVNRVDCGRGNLLNLAAAAIRLAKRRK
jgi:hypothetical protein